MITEASEFLILWLLPKTRLLASQWEAQVCRTEWGWLFPKTRLNNLTVSSRRMCYQAELFMHYYWNSYHLSQIIKVAAKTSLCPALFWCIGCTFPDLACILSDWNVGPHPSSHCRHCGPWASGKTGQVWAGVARTLWCYSCQSALPEGASNALVHMSR